MAENMASEVPGRFDRHILLVKRWVWACIHYLNSGLEQISEKRAVFPNSSVAT